MAKDNAPPSPPSRREMLNLIGAASVVAWAGCKTPAEGDDDDATAADDDTTPGDDDTTSDDDATPDDDATSDDDTTSGDDDTTPPDNAECEERPEQTEGPYFVDELLNRSDIRTDPTDGSVSEGIKLSLAFAVGQVQGETCTPLADAQVDIWHCDAAGLYSDEASEGTEGRKFLRGYQLTDADGMARFITIFPGWYSGRTIHIHFKIRLFKGDETVYDFTSQLNFDGALCDTVMLLPPYDTRGLQDTTNEEDGIFSSDGDSLMLDLAEDGEGGYTGTFNIGLTGI